MGVVPISGLVFTYSGVCESSHTVSIIDADVLTLKNNKTVVSRSASKSDADSKSFTDARRDQ